MGSTSRLKIVAWNANGLGQHLKELIVFINHNSIDVLLISETHFTDKSFARIPNYKIFVTNHPDNKAHGGTAIIIRQDIKCIELEKYEKENIQATSIQIEDEGGKLTISAVYCPPKYINSIPQYYDFLKTLGKRYIAGGDYNAKNAIWGSRLTNSKGRNLLDAIKRNNSKFISSGDPTYWPTDPKKSPDLIDFFITKNVNHEDMSIKSLIELSSDHSPIIMIYQSSYTKESSNRNVYNKKTCWDTFREIVIRNLNNKISLKTFDEIDSAIAYFNHTIMNATMKSTPQETICSSSYNIPAHIQEKIKIKNRLRKRWQITRLPLDKSKLNAATKEIKQMLFDHKNMKLKRRIEKLGPGITTNYSLWKATNKIENKILYKPPIRKLDGSWTRTNLDKAEVLAKHFKSTFTNNTPNVNLFPTHAKKDPCKPKNVTLEEIKQCICKRTDPKKSPGYDLITGKILRELPEKGLIYIRNLFNQILNLKYFPKVWKIAQIIAIPKPCKDPTQVTSYRPISLLPVLSKIFEKLLFDRIDPIIQKDKIIPCHQFGFRQKHSTIQQVHRVTNKIFEDIDKKRTCEAVYLDVAKAFDTVWHAGLLQKLLTYLPTDYYELMKSYITGRQFYVKFEDKYSDILTMEAGVPQGSVLGPLLYLLYTADIPTPATKNSLIATFADDTVLLASDKDPRTAAYKLQELLDNTTQWFEKWGIKINEDKTAHVTYTNKRKKQYNPIFIKNKQIHHDTRAKYLGMIIDNKLNWKLHIGQKRREIKTRFKQLHWLLGKNSTLSLENKILIYKVIITPIWKYGSELWGTASRTNIKIIQQTQNKILRIISKAEWYILNDNIHRELKVKTVHEEIRNNSLRHTNRLLEHSNREIRQLPLKEETETRRLKRKRPTDLQM